MTRLPLFLLRFLILMAVVWPDLASAATSTKVETRVMGIALVAPSLIGGSSARSPEKHLGSSLAYDEIASGSPLAAKGGGGGGGDKSATTPSGQRGSPMNVPQGTNEPTTINGRQYTGHALDQMQGRGLTPTVVEDAIQNGATSPGNQPGTFQHEVPGVRVITNTGGGVITVIPK